MKIYLYFFLFLASSFFGCNNIPVQRLSELDKKELKDLQNNLYLLDGEWEFYWNALLSPSDFEVPARLPEPLLVQVPNVWTNYTNKDEKSIPEYGFATYRLVINLEGTSDLRYGMYIPKIWCAAKVWVNGELVHQAGKVAKSLKEFENKLLENFTPIFIYDSLKKLDIIVQVANYNLYTSSGLLKNFEFGEYKNIYTDVALRNALNLTWIGCILIMAIYHYVLFSLRHRKSYSTLYFALICTSIATGWLMFGDHFLYIFLKEEWKITYFFQSKIYFISMLSLVPLGLGYLSCLYPEKVYRKIIRIAVVLFASFGLFILVAPPVVFSPIIPIFMSILSIFLIYPLFNVLILVAIRRRKEWILQMAGICIMVLAGINDALASQGIYLTDQLETLQYALGIFLVVQFYVLTKRFSDAFKEVEDLSLNLEEKILQRTRKITEQNTEIEYKNFQLQDALKNITSSVRYASSLQKAILSSEKRIENGFPDSFILYLPRDMVSGDFFWYEDQFTESRGNHSEKLKILIAADCTGHGVPGALMTVLGNNFLDDIIKKEHIIKPDQILYHLDKRVIKTFLDSENKSQRNDGMDMSIILVDEHTKVLYFAGAKNPLYHIREDTIRIVKGSKFPIGSFQFKHGKIFENCMLPIQKGDIFYIFSDGFSDQFGGVQNRKYLKKRFRENLFKMRKLSMREQKNNLMDAFHKWKGKTPQTDDVLVIGFRI